MTQLGVHTDGHHHPMTTPGGHRGAHVGHVVAFGEQQIFCERICGLLPWDGFARKRRFIHGELHDRHETNVCRNFLTFLESNKVTWQQHVCRNFDVLAASITTHWLMALDLSRSTASSAFPSCQKPNAALAVSTMKMKIASPGLSG